MLSKLLSRQGVRDLFLGLALLCATLSLMLYPQDSMSAAREGLKLCYNVIIPSLFPFFVLSALVVDLGLAGYIGRALEGLMRPLFNVPGACASAFVLGFVGGYPVGARTALSLYQKGMCTKTEAERLLSFCNNSGPAFILGVVGAGVFASSRVGVLLSLAHAAASICVGLFFRFYRRGKKGREARVSPKFEAERFTTAFTGAVKNSFLSTLNICAFVVFFTVVIRLLFLSGALPALARLLGVLLSPLGFTQEWAERLLTGAIELSSGVWTLSGAGGMAGRMSMAAFMLGWAGISVHCQVLSFIGDSGLSVRTYLAGKLCHGIIAAALTAAVTRFFPLSEPVSSYLAEQAETIAGLDFTSALAISLATVFVVWTLWVLLCGMMVKKNGGKMPRHRL